MSVLSKLAVPEGPHGFIQWKGTSVCLDFYCSCGHHSHIDGEFVYAVRCRCGKTYAVNPHVSLFELNEHEAAYYKDTTHSDERDVVEALTQEAEKDGLEY